MGAKVEKKNQLWGGGQICEIDLKKNKKKIESPVIIGSRNGLALNQYQAILWTNADFSYILEVMKKSKIFVKFTHFMMQNWNKIVITFSCFFPPDLMC